MVGANRQGIENVPLSKRPVKAGRVSPLQLFKRSESFSGNLGGNAGIILVPVYYWGEIFYCKKFDPKETKFFKEVLKC